MIDTEWIPFEVDASEASAYIPMDQWGHDHFSVLAYLETVAVDDAGIINNYRMRCHPRLHREFAFITPFSPHTAEGEYPTRLKGGAKLSGHDDWSVLADLVAAGILRAWYRRLNERMFGNSQAKIELTESGRALANELRAHKASGGTYANFEPQTEVIR